MNFMAQQYVRRLGPDDTAAFKEIRLEALEKHPQAFGAAFEEEALCSLQRFTERLEGNVVLGGYLENGCLNGIVAVANAKGSKSKHIATIWGMYVRPVARGTGLSRTLLEAAIVEARSACRSVRLSVVSSNLGAIRLYESQGFKVWARDRDALRVGEQYHDEFLMRLDFAPSADR